MSDQPSLFENKSLSPTANRQPRIFIGLDIEATGLDPRQEKIIEIAMVKFDDDKIIDKFTTLINPEKEIPDEVVRLTGIKDLDVACAPKLPEVKDKIIEFMQNYPILGHFIEFDINFLNEHGFDIKNKQLDTYELAKILLENEPSYNLEILGQKFGIIHENAHRAYDDTIACIELFKALQKNIRQLPSNLCSKIKEIIQKSNFVWGDEFIYQFSQRTDIESANFMTNESNENLIEKYKEYKKIEAKDFRLPNPNSDIKDIIQSPLNYLDIEKFKNFLTSSSFDNSESCFIIKMIIFIDKFQKDINNKNELISKNIIRLDGAERNIWSALSYDLQNFLYTDFWSSKTSTNEISVSDDFVFELMFSEKNLIEKQNSLIIENVNEFLKNMIKNLCSVITLNKFFQYQKNEDIKQKYTMLFGLIGLFYNKVFGELKSENELNIKDIEEYSFYHIKNSIQNIKSNYSLSIEEEIMLNDIYEIDMNNFIYTLTLTDKDGIIFKKYPLNINEKINKINNLFAKIKVESNFPISDLEKEYINRILGDFELIEKKTEKIDIGSNDLDYIFNIINEEDSDFIFLSTSDSNIKNLILRLEENISGNAVIISPLQKLSPGKIEHFWQKNEDNKRILISRPQYFANFVKNPKNKFKESLVLIIDVIPFDNAKYITNRIISRNYRNFFIEYIVPKASLDIKNIIDVFSNLNIKNKRIFISDRRIIAYDGAITNNLSNMINLCS